MRESKLSVAVSVETDRDEVGGDDQPKVREKPGRAARATNRRSSLTIRPTAAIVGLSGA
jgi:hypothetical protein